MPEGIQTPSAIRNQGQDILTVLAEHREKLEADLGQRFMPMEDFEDRVKAAVEAATNGSTTAEIHEKVLKISEAAEQYANQITDIRAEVADMRMRNSNDLPRIQKQGNKFNGLAFDKAIEAKFRLMLEGGPAMQRNLDEVNAAINEGGADRDAVERHFDLIEKKSAHGLDLAMKEARDIALGRSTGQIVSDGRAKDNHIYDGINASLSTAADSGGPVIATIWDTTLWSVMNALGDRFIPEIPQVSVSGAKTQLPMWGADVWDITRAQAELGNRQDAAISMETLELTVRDLEFRTFISQNLLDDSAPAVDSEFRNVAPDIFARGLDMAVLLGDRNTNAAQNANTMAYQAPSQGNPRIPAFWGSLGLFAYALAEADAQIDLGGAFTTNNCETQMEALRELLGWGAKDTMDALYICGLTERFAIRRFAETYRTLDNVGAMATALTGDLRRLGGMQIFTPRAFPDGVAADGRFDAATPANNSHGVVLAVARNQVRFGVRRMPRVMVYPNAQLGADGIYPGIRGRFVFGMKDRNPDTGALVAEADRSNLSNERGVSMLRGIVRP